MFSVNKADNVILSSLSNDDLISLFRKINETPLSFRNRLYLPDYVSFGNEIEVNDMPLDKTVLLVELFNDVFDLFNKNRYVVHQEETADAEIITPILTDTTTNWSVFSEMYSLLSDSGATLAGNTSSHLHIGTHKINTPEKLSLLLKTLVVFEPIIFKFGYGEDTEPRIFLRAREDRSIFSPMMTPKRVATFTDSLDKYNYRNPGEMNGRFRDFVASELRFRPVFNFRDFDFNKLQYGIAGDLPSSADHFEVRCFNGTLKPEIAQNNINLITKIVVAVVEGNIDKDYINAEYKRYKKKRYNFDRFCAMLDTEEEIAQYNRLLDGFNKVKMEKALKLADMIFDNELDKYYFLKQYLKLFNLEDEEVIKLVK